MISHPFNQIAQPSGGFDDVRAPSFPRFCLFIIAIDDETLLCDAVITDIVIQINILISDTTGSLFGTNHLNPSVLKRLCPRQTTLPWSCKRAAALFFLTQIKSIPHYSKTHFIKA